LPVVQNTGELVAAPALSNATRSDESLRTSRSWRTWIHLRRAKALALFAAPPRTIEAAQSRLNMIEANHPVITAIMAVARP
jgi:hypothetical protein